MKIKVPGTTCEKQGTTYKIDGTIYKSKLSTILKNKGTRL